MASSKTAAINSMRLGNRRNSVAMPTPAVRAMHAIDALSPSRR